MLIDVDKSVLASNQLCHRYPWTEHRARWVVQRLW